MAQNEEDLDKLPMQKTSPLVFVGIGGALLIGASLVGYMVVSGKREAQANKEAAAAMESAKLKSAMDEAEKAKKIEHLKISAEAYAAAADEDKTKKAAEEAKKQETAEADKGGDKPAGGAAAKPAGGRSPSSNELNELDKLGSATASELGK